MSAVIPTDNLPATTRAFTRVRPLMSPRAPDLQEMLFLPPHPHRQAEGGLRRRGCFKELRSGRPLITVITVVRNQAQNVAATIESVLGQTYDDVEYILIDGGSIDGTVDVIRRYDSAIDYWVSEPDSGISDAFNKGLRVATGEWINFLNAGDAFASPDVLSRVAACADKTADVVYGRANLVGPQGKIVCALGTAFDSARFRRTMTFRHQALFHNIGYFEKYGSFDRGITVAMDYELLRRKPELSVRFCDCVVTNEMLPGLSERLDFLRCRECRDVGLKHASGFPVLLVHLHYLYAVGRCCLRRILQKLGLHRWVARYRGGKFRLPREIRPPRDSRWTGNVR